MTRNSTTRIAWRRSNCAVLTTTLGEKLADGKVDDLIREADDDGNLVTQLRAHPKVSVA